MKETGANQSEIRQNANLVRNHEVYYALYNLYFTSGASLSHVD